MHQRILLIVSCAILMACNAPSRQAADPTGGIDIPVKYAAGFRITHFDDYKLVEVNQAYPGASGTIKYLLVNPNQPLPDYDSDTKIIRTPIASIVCTSTTHIPLLEYLDVAETLVGFPTTRYISSVKVRERIDAGLVQELGVDKGMNLELLTQLNPQAVMAYSLTGDMGQFKKIESLGIPVILNGEYLEHHPLGRAEWIKFAAAFFDKETYADSVFNQIEKAYLNTLALVSHKEPKPTVLSGIVYGDTWFLPGGQNYAARLFTDAGFTYLWSENENNAFLELSFESVYEKAHRADFWIGVGSYTSLQELTEADQRYTRFDAVKNHMVYTYDYRKGATGGSEFLELGYLRPDIIIKDLVKIAYPELLPDYSLYFHKQLE